MSDERYESEMRELREAIAKVYAHLIEYMEETNRNLTGLRADLDRLFAEIEKLSLDRA